MSKYDVDKIFRNLSTVNGMTESLEKLNKSFVNYDEFMGLSSVSRIESPLVELNQSVESFHRGYDAIELVKMKSTFPESILGPDKPNIAIDPDLIKPRGTIVKNIYKIDSKAFQIGDGNTQASVEQVASSSDEGISIARRSLNITIIGVIVAIIGVIVSVVIYLSGT
ncbi:hypothetical protein [Vibrio renipiscarius]|uniref:Uncharacterized protein n=1 Tax=Vibrio renipiscarius TaxID=1461322 RepID=A0A0C2JNV9_9VIBR|nr:hypothetical protein [Vibrio renipiscarius]KII79764.1 hypothetical protein PL18_08955 [Vibrio renipiscarius]KII80609.1 hypothetical protein OJ16_04710 [Vibrio renipiscarius]